MGLIRTSCFIILAVLLFAWASTSSLVNKIYEEEVLLKQLVDPSSGEIDDSLVEELLFQCKLDLIILNDAFRKLHLRLPEEKHDEIHRKSWLFERQNIQKTILLLHPQVRETLLDCLQKRNTILRRVSGEEDSGSKSSYSTFLDAIYPRDYVPRRNLQVLNGAPAPGPAFESPSPSPAPAFTPPPTPGADIPAPAPRTPFFPPSTDSRGTGIPPSENSTTGSNAVGEDHRNSNSNSHRRSVVIAVAVTASLTFFAVVVLFSCCGGYCGPGSKLRRNDERPLLSLSLSDFSIGGSSPYQFGNGNHIKEDRNNQHQYGNSYFNQSLGSSLDGNFHMPFNSVYTPSQQSVSSASSAGAYQYKPHGFNPFDSSYDSYTHSTNPPLKPPPGWAAAAVPIRPPPGRAEPLPPEPPSSFKPPSTRPTPPHPAPPVPPPSLKPIVTADPPPPAPAPPPPPPPPKPSPPPPPPAPPAPRAPPPPPPPRGSGPPPPPPKGGGPPPRPSSLPAGSKVARPPPSGPRHVANSSFGGTSSEDEGDAPKAKLKPFFWDKVMANPDHSMVWHQIKSGSFQFDENMIESLFGYAATDKGKTEQKKESSSQDPSPPQFIQLIDAKKSQNLAILLRALNVTIEEVCDALREGNELPSEFVQNLLKMTPTADEELKLRLFNGDPSQLGTAERFLKALIDIPCAFKRLEALLFMSTVTEEVAIVKESFETLETACTELRNSRLFLKLLEAVLKTGNRMNDGTFRGKAQAFKLDTLLKLSDVKGTDGKTTLLLFVVQEIIRSEGIRAIRVARENKSLASIKSDDLQEEVVNDTEENYRSLGLEIVSSLGDELENVKKASILDAESLTGTVEKLGQSLLKTRHFLKTDMKSLEEDSDFYRTLKNFVQNAEVEIMGLLEEEKRIMALVKSTGDYFHGNSGKDEGLRLFVIVRDFLIMVDKACREVREASKKPVKGPKKETSSADLHQLGVQSSSSSEPRQSPVDLREKLFPAVANRRMGYYSSDDES